MIINRYVLNKSTKSIIVGGKMSNIVLSTAKILSDEQVNIEELEISDTDDLLYLCGHSNKSAKTIGKRTMKEIADLLVKVGYKGLQPIYVTSCDSVDMLRLLDYHLQLLLNESGELTLESIDNKEPIYVKGNADGSTVTLKEDNENVLYVLKAEGKVENFISSLTLLKQNIFHEKSDYVDKYKRKLIAREYHLGVFTTVSSIVSLFLAFILLTIVIGAILLLKLSIPYVPSVMISVVVLICLDIITRKLTKSTIDTAVMHYNLGNLLFLTVLRYFIYLFLFSASVLNYLF